MPGKYQQWLTLDGLVLLRGWARDGLTDAQIADRCGITKSTLYLWKKKFPSLSDAIKKGKEVVDYEVENALLDNALAGDTTAQIYWLKNRKPGNWRDRRDAPEKCRDGEIAAQAGLLEAIKEAADHADH